MVVSSNQAQGIDVPAGRVAGDVALGVASAGLGSQMANGTRAGVIAAELYGASLAAYLEADYQYWQNRSAVGDGSEESLMCE